MDVRTLEAGRELDALVSEHLMHELRWIIPGRRAVVGTSLAAEIFPDGVHKRLQFNEDGSPKWTRGERDRWFTEAVPHYSTDIAAAWQVIRRLYEITTEGQWDWFCDMQNAADIWRKTDSEAATIICQSALAVIEAKTTIEANTQ